MAGFGQNCGFDENGFIRLKKDLDHTLRHMNHQNVKQLYTEYCNIQSENGETVIDGPTLKFYGADTTLQRMNIGYSSVDSDFGFWVKDIAGNLTAYLDSTGRLVVTRLLSGYVYGSTIEGGIISGATITAGLTNRIRLSESGDDGQIQFLASDGSTACKMYFSTGQFFMGGQTLTVEGSFLYLNPSSGISMFPGGDIVMAPTNKAYYGGNASSDEIGTKGWVTAQGYMTGTAGESGVFTLAGGGTITVSNGLVTSVST